MSLFSGDNVFALSGNIHFVIIKADCLLIILGSFHSRCFDWGVPNIMKKASGPATPQCDIVSINPEKETAYCFSSLRPYFAIWGKIVCIGQLSLLYSIFIYKHNNKKHSVHINSLKTFHYSEPRMSKLFMNALC